MRIDSVGLTLKYIGTCTYIIVAYYTAAYIIQVQVPILFSVNSTLPILRINFKNEDHLKKKKEFI